MRCLHKLLHSLGETNDVITSLVKHMSKSNNCKFSGMNWNLSHKYNMLAVLPTENNTYQRGIHWKTVTYPESTGRGWSPLIYSKFCVPYMYLGQWQVSLLSTFLATLILQLPFTCYHKSQICSRSHHKLKCEFIVNLLFFTCMRPSLLECN